VSQVATSYTTNALLQKPGTADRNWDIPVNANADLLDGMTAIGGLVVTPTEVPSASLNVRVTGGNYIKADGTIGTFAGVASYALAASTTSCLWLADAGVLTTGAAFPTTAHVRLARVVAGATSIVSVVDNRVQCRIAGTGLGFVLKTGDTISGPLTVATPATGTPVLAVDAVNRALGFFGATPASQAAPLAALTDNSTGTASGTIVDVGGSFSQSQIDNNFASLTAKVNALIAAMKRHGLMSS
jgi:hypothetical protein